jgi:PAS domain S-box-containing protein
MQTSVETKKTEVPAGTDTIGVLLVDDDVRNLDVLGSILDSPELRLVRALTPEDALLALVHNEFACIVLDVQMPSMNGVDLARLIKTRKKSQHIPIIFLTAYFLEEKDILQGYGVGAVDYLTKPLNSAILKSKVGVFVDLFRTTHALAKANSSLELEILKRHKVEEELRQSNVKLETHVQYRTLELIRVNEELRQEKERYRQLIHGLPTAVYTTDAEGHVTLYNEAAVTLWGREPVIGKDLWCGSYKIFKPDGTELPLDQCPMACTLKLGRAIRGKEIIIERPDQSRRHILPYPEPLYDTSGKIIGAVNMLVDITERKKAEIASRQLAAIVESSGDAIISKNLNSIITTWNESAERLFGYTAEEMIGRSVTVLMPPELHADEPGIVNRIRNGERIDQFETIRCRKDGSRFEVSLTISPIKDTGGHIIGASKIVQDITQRRRTEQELKIAHDKLLAASNAKDNFLATLSHELRTPLNPILLIASDAAQNHELAPEVRSDFEMIRKNVELEARLIDDLLDLTSITRGKVVLEKNLFDVHAVLQDSISTVVDEIKQKQITLIRRFDSEKHAVFVDAVRLQQIFWNLLRNAAKFTPKQGRITIETRVLTGEGIITIGITDTGIGMNAEEIGRIFQPFSQGDHADNTGHRFGGLGLGLAISQKLVELHGGQIHAASDGRDKGSLFTVKLPLAVDAGKGGVPKTAAPVTSMPAASAKKTGLRILLVEDHEPTRTALKHLLVRRAYEVMTAASLAEARALAGAQDFDLLISDIGLPDGNGYDLMNELGKNKVIKGIALTGFGMEQDLVRSRDAGFVAHLTKPVRVQLLDAAIEAAVKLMA